MFILYFTYIYVYIFIDFLWLICHKFLYLNIFAILLNIVINECVFSTLSSVYVVHIVNYHNNGKAQTLHGLDQSQPILDELKPTASFHCIQQSQW